MKRCTNGSRAAQVLGRCQCTDHVGSNPNKLPTGRHVPWSLRGPSLSLQYLHKAFLDFPYHHRIAAHDLLHYVPTHLCHFASRDTLDVQCSLSTMDRRTPFRTYSPGYVLNLLSDATVSSPSRHSCSHTYVAVKHGRMRTGRPGSCSNTQSCHRFQPTFYFHIPDLCGEGRLSFARLRNAVGDDPGSWIQLWSIPFQVMLILQWATNRYLIHTTPTPPSL